MNKEFQRKDNRRSLFTSKAVSNLCEIVSGEEEKDHEDRVSLERELLLQRNGMVKVTDGVVNV